MADRKHLEAMARQLADDGRLIEAGWVAFRIHAIPKEAAAAQLRDMRMAYMNGAQHLFASIMTILDPGGDPTDADMRRMDLIADELEAYRKELELTVATPRGQA